MSIGMAMALAVAISASPVQAGSENSGGTDYHPDTPAWFSSQDASRKISACYEISPTFIADPTKGVDTARIGKIITDAFRQWNTYYHVTKGLKGQSYSGFDDPSKPPREIVFQLAADPAAHCNGSEDISFYFGVEPAEVKEAKTKLYNPFAFAAIRTSAPGSAPAAGADRFWNPGFIYVADTGAVQPSQNVPMWTNYDGLPLERIIAHELGHVFGCSHVQGTIMADLSQWMLEKTQKSHSQRPRSYFSPSEQAKLLAVDQTYDLVTVLWGEESYALKVSDPNSIYQLPTAAGLFKRLAGKAPIGDVTAQVFRSAVANSWGPGGPAVREGAGKVVLTDSTGKYEFPFSITNLIGEVGTPGEAFYSNGSSRSRTSKTFMGSLKQASGAPIPVAVNYNFDYARFGLVDLSVPQDPGTAFVYPNRFILQAN